MYNSVSNIKINKTRWNQAQRFEESEWAKDDTVVEKEWEEARAKYGKYLAELEKNLGISSASNILDVGCGPTCMSRIISKGKHFGIEPLADELDVDSKISEIKVYQGMAENMPFDNDKFDFVICRNVIDHTYDPEEVIKEVYRVIKPEGFFLLCSYVYNPFIATTKKVGENFRAFRNVGHPHTFTERSLEESVSEKFDIIERKIIYEGISPNDFGKIDEVQNSLSKIQKLVMLVNDLLLRNKWFVREYSLLCRPKEI